MNDWGFSVLEQFPLEVVRSRRGRGTLIVETDQGWKLLAPYQGTEGHLALEQSILLYLKEHWDVGVDAYVDRCEGGFLAVSEEGIRYVLKDWYPYNECDVSHEESVLKAVQILASLHGKLRFLSVEGDSRRDVLEDSLLFEMEKHNRELRRIRSYVRQKSKKTEFELCILESFDQMYEQAAQATECLRQSRYQNLYLNVVSQHFFCHGNYHQHNVLLREDGCAVTNFSNSGKQLQIVDLYRFMRKVLEKHNWDIGLGEKMLLAYHKEMPISQEELPVLQALFSYPEKYWKQLNFYYNSNKAWIPKRSVEKLKNASKQYWERENFVAQALK